MYMYIFIYGSIIYWSFFAHRAPKHYSFYCLYMYVYVYAYVYLYMYMYI